MTMFLTRVLTTIPKYGLHLKSSNGFYSNYGRLVLTHGSIKHCSASAADNEILTSENMERASVETIVQDIKSNIKLKHGTKYDYSFNDINNVIEYLKKYNDIRKKQLVNLFVKQPNLCQYFCQSWENTLVVLHGNGIQGSRIVEMLTDCPQILRRNPSKIEQTLNCLREYQFADKLLINLILKIPVLLVTDATFISHQITKLMTLFTQKDILKLAIRSPNVLLEDFDDIEEKVRYIIYKIGVDQTQIVTSMALTHSYHHLRLRHQVMLRSGIYKKPHLKKKLNNPPLSVMTDTSTHEFVKDIVGISLEQFAVFENMLEREIAHSELNEDSGSENESENEDD